MIPQKKGHLRAKAMVQRTGLPHIWKDKDGVTLWIHFPKGDWTPRARDQFQQWVEAIEANRRTR